MKARITSKGHVWLHKSGLLRVRVDFFPESSDPLYDGCHVQVPERDLTPREEAQVAKGKDEEEQSAILEQILAAIPKVWRVNPINCHMFLLPLGFTQADIEAAARERIPQLKAVMAEAQGHGFKELRGLPSQMCYATRPPKGIGKPAVSPGKEKKWTPRLVEQVGVVLNGLEVRE